MSTYINITVGKYGLKEKAKQQTNANRQAKLEADARAKAEAEGKRQRDLERAKQGLGPDGEPLYGVPTKAPAYKEEPAAARTGDYLLLMPSTPPNANQWFNAGAVAEIPVQVRGRYPRTVTSSTSNTVGLARPTYYASGGPSNAPMLGAVPTSNDNYVTLTGIRDGVTTNSIKRLTLQLYFRFGDTMSSFQPYPEVLVELGQATSANNVQMFFNLEGQATLLKTLYYRIGNTPLYSEKVELSDTSRPALQAGTWHHVALTMAESTGYAFFDGSLIAEKVLPFSAIDIGGGSGWLDVAFGHTVTGFAIPGQTVYIQGLKYEPLCRWKASFTPPPFIR